MKRAYGWLFFAVVLASLLGATLITFHHADVTRQLVAAVNRQDAPGVEALLRQGADPNARDWKTYYYDPKGPFIPPWYERPLALLKRRAPYVDNYIGPTVLMIAAHHGDTMTARTLLDHGADITKAGTGVGELWPGPVLPVVEAMRSGSKPTALLLIDRGTAATDSAPDEHDFTPLMNAQDPEVALALINHGADVNGVRQTDGSTPFLSVVFKASAASEPSSIATLSLLLAKGSKINAPNAFGWTPLIMAANHRKSGITKFLLDRGADVNVCDCSHDTALIKAAAARDGASVALLLSHGADVNAKNSDGATALMLVSYPGSVPCFPPHPHWRSERRAMQKLLLRYGANPRLKDKEGETAADYEKEQASPQVCGWAG